MRISDVPTVLLTGPSTNDRFLVEARKRRSAAFVEVHTDTGLVGIGETYAGYFCPELVPGIVDFFKPVLVGQDVDNIQELWDRMYHCGIYWGRVGLGLAVLSAIDAAPLWDLKGKLTGLPVYELLGGRKQDRLLGYATGGPSNYPKERLLSKIDYYLSLGFHAFKLGAGAFSEGKLNLPGTPAEAADQEAEKIEFVRRHVGPDVQVMLDGHMGNRGARAWKWETAAAVMKALEPFKLFFFEEPLPYTDPWGYAERVANCGKSAGISVRGFEAAKSAMSRATGSLFSAMFWPREPPGWRPIWKSCEP